MKYAFAALAFIVLLAGCAGTGENEREEILEIRTEYIAERVLTLTAELTADYGERVYVYTLRYTGGADSGTMEVLSPEHIKGVSAVCDGDRVSLRSGDTVVDTGQLVFGMCPLEAFPFMINAWSSGYITSSWHESVNGTECVAAEIDMSRWEDAAICRVWFGKEDHRPVSSEIYVDGRCVMRCKFLETVA